MSNERFTANEKLRERLADEERSVAWLARKSTVNQSLIEKALRGERTLGREAAEKVALVLRSDIFLLFDVAPVRSRRANETKETVAA